MRHLCQIISVLNKNRAGWAPWNFLIDLAIQGDVIVDIQVSQGLRLIYPSLMLFHVLVLLIDNKLCDRHANADRLFLPFGEGRKDISKFTHKRLAMYRVVRASLV